MMKFVKKVVLSVVTLILHSSFGFLYFRGGLPGRLAASAYATLNVSIGAFKKKSLDLSGAIAAWVVGTVTFFGSLRLALLLLAFFYSSSKLTKAKQRFKAAIDAGYKINGQRNWIQVMCSGGLATLFALPYGLSTGFSDIPLGLISGGLSTFLFGIVFGSFACCCGDTWASEVGVFSKETPRLITSLRPVKRGTNGAVSVLGLMCSLAGGILMGLIVFIYGLVVRNGLTLSQAAQTQWPLIWIGAIGGLLGSAIDSILGALLQFSGYHVARHKVVGHPGPGVHRISGADILSNEHVNLLSSMTTAIFIAFLCKAIF